MGKEMPAVSSTCCKYSKSP